MVPLPRAYFVWVRGLVSVSELGSYASVVTPTKWVLSDFPDKEKYLGHSGWGLEDWANNPIPIEKLKLMWRILQLHWPQGANLDALADIRI